VNRKQRRANKIPAQPKPLKSPDKKYEVTFAGSDPDTLSRREVSIVLAMIQQVPFAVKIVEDQPIPTDEDDPPFNMPHIHVVFNETRKVCLRWQETDIPRVVVSKCETL
jgi:hypothetical protein